VTSHQRRWDRRREAGDDPIPVADVLEKLTARLGAGPAGVLVTVFGKWEDIVGSAIALHVRPVRLDGGTLIVGADHPAWATQTRRLSSEVLARLREACGDDGAPQRLEVRVMR
jgi:predicted nucleic acid-binding Zn ribbon protein